MHSKLPWIAALAVQLSPLVACGGDASPISDGDPTEVDAGRGPSPAAGASATDRAQNDDAQPDAGAASDPVAPSHEPPGGTLFLFYLDITGSRVLRVDPEVGAEEVLVTGAGTMPDGIALDVPAGHIYWTTMGLPTAQDGSVMRADLDGSNVIAVVPVGAITTPKQMRIDLGAGKLYWSDREGMRVMRSNLDGSEIETLVTVATGDAAVADAANHCVGLALDEDAQMVYWTQKGPDNGGVGSIRRAPYDIPDGETSANRSDIEVLFEGLPEPIDLELDLAERLIYWTDRGDDTVNRGPMDDPTASDREILVTGVSEAIGIALDLHRGEMFYTSLATGVVGSANLDGSNAHDVVDSAGSLVGIAAVYLDE